MPGGGHIYIRALNMPAWDSVLGVDSVMLQIRDEGVGISKDIIDRIFDPYFSTKQTGSGLGLAMVSGIIEKHSGRIRVQSTLGQETVFTVYLPADPGGMPDVSGDKEAAFDLTAPQGMKALIIDDDSTVADALADMLQLQGFAVDVAEEGDKGINIYRTAFENRDPYVITFLDLTIPGGKGGKEAVKDILNIDPEARVIAISGYSTDPIMANYTKFGFRGRLIKPFLLKEVKAELYRVVSN